MRFPETTGTELTSDTVPRHGDLPSVPTTDAVFLLNVETGHYLMLGDTAREIWDQIDGRRTVGEIVGHLVNEFDVDRETCNSDVVEFLTHLNDEGLIKLGPR